MGNVFKNFRLNLFTFIEIVFAFVVITIALSIDLGYINQVKSNLTKVGSLELLYGLNAFTFLAVLVTALGITGIQLIQIYRRTGEIGLRKAVGANDSDIITLILKDTLFLILIPALSGVVVGIALSAVIPFDKLGLQAGIDFMLIAGCSIALLLFTLLSGIIPAIKAVRMNPAEVLRKHGVAKRVSISRTYNVLFFLISAIVIISGICINYSLEAEYKKDVLNSAGAPPATTQAVPTFSFKDATGEVISSETLKNRSYCLLIWEVGCTLSTDTLNELNRLVTDGQLESSNIYAVSIDKSFDKVKEYVTANKMSVVPYIDYKKSTKWAFKANAIPALYIVDKNGVISARVLGWSETMREYLIKKISMN